MMIRATMLLFLVIMIMPNMVISAVPNQPSATKKLQDVIAITNAMKNLVDVFEETTAPNEKTLTYILDNSTVIGKLLYQGISVEGIEDSQEEKNMSSTKFDLYVATNPASIFVDRKFEKFFNKYASIHTIKAVLIHFDFGKKELEKFLKNECSKHDWIGSFEVLQYSLVLYGNNIDEAESFSSKDFIEIYQKSTKEMFMFSTICEILCHGPLSQDAIQNRINNFLQINENVQNNLTTILAIKKEQYWTFKALKQFLSLRVSDSDDTRKTVSNVKNWFSYYNDQTDYVYHIGVSKAANGFNNAVTYCSSECHHLNNYNGKNVYILRNKINKNGYQKCNYLETFNDKDKTSNFCDKFAKKKRAFGDLRDLVNDIISNCNLMAISIVKDSFDYQSGYDDDNALTTRAYDFPCYGKINIAIANFPL